MLLAVHEKASLFMGDDCPMLLLQRGLIQIIIHPVPCSADCCLQ